MSSASVYHADYWYYGSILDGLTPAVAQHLAYQRITGIVRQQTAEI